MFNVSCTRINKWGGQKSLILIPLMLSFCSLRVLFIPFRYLQSWVYIYSELICLFNQMDFNRAYVCCYTFLQVADEMMMHTVWVPIDSGPVSDECVCVYVIGRMIECRIWIDRVRSFHFNRNVYGKKYIMCIVYSICIYSLFLVLVHFLL